jgi:hypothetical protein
VEDLEDNAQQQGDGQEQAGVAEQLEQSDVLGGRGDHCLATSQHYDENTAFPNPPAASQATAA